MLSSKDPILSTIDDTLKTIEKANAKQPIETEESLIQRNDADLNEKLYAEKRRFSYTGEFIKTLKRFPSEWTRVFEIPGFKASMYVSAITFGASLGIGSLLYKKNILKHGLQVFLVGTMGGCIGSLVSMTYIVLQRDKQEVAFHDVGMKAAARGGDYNRVK